MMVSDFAPTVLNPIGYGIAELHRLLIDFRVQAFTRSIDYDGHLATMPSAQSPAGLPLPALSMSISFARNRRWQRLRPGLLDQWPDW